MKKDTSPTFCSMAWNHQFVDPTGRVKPCCRFAENSRPAENNLNTKTLSEIFYGKWMDDIRQKMLIGEQVSGCIRCYQEEESGKRSLRQRYHDNTDLPVEELVDLRLPTIRWIELAISNDCNIACRMCDSRYAWKWFKEEQVMYNGQSLNNIEHSKMDIANVFPFIKDLVHIKFTGGEPLITPDHWKLLDKLLAERDCSEIFLNYSTNCTIMPTDNWVAMWDKFKHVDFALSYDTSDKLEAEYIRWPATYETIEDVTKRFLQLSQRHNYNMVLRSTISILNVWNLPETLMWWLDHCDDDVRLNPTHLTYPEELCLTVLPLELKQKVVTKFEKFKETCTIEKVNVNLDYIMNFMNSKDDTHLLPKLRYYINSTDKYRKQNFFTAYPQFLDIFSAHSAKNGL